MKQHKRSTILAGLLFLAASTMAACNDDPVTVEEDDRELAAEIRVLSGGNQIGAPGAALTEEIVVEVRDVIRRRIGGVEIVFEPLEGHGTAVPDTILANDIGRAGVIWTLGTTPGEQVLLVRADTIIIEITATAEAAGSGIRRH